MPRVICYQSMNGSELTLLLVWREAQWHIVATIAGDGSDVGEGEDILNIIISASDALRYAKGLRAYIQQQSKIEVSLSFLNELTSLEKNLAVQEINSKNKRRLIFLDRVPNWWAIPSDPCNNAQVLTVVNRIKFIYNDNWLNLLCCRYKVKFSI